MKISALLLVSVVSAAIGGGLSPQGLAEELSAGVAVVDITPPVGYRLSGYFVERRSTGTHDPLLAKACRRRRRSRKEAMKR